MKDTFAGMHGALSHVAQDPGPLRADYLTNATKIFQCFMHKLYHSQRKKLQETGAKGQQYQNMAIFPSKCEIKAESNLQVSYYYFASYNTVVIGLMLLANAATVLGKSNIGEYPHERLSTVRLGPGHSHTDTALKSHRSNIRDRLRDMKRWLAKRRRSIISYWQS
jgi:hypothetical protein